MKPTKDPRETHQTTEKTFKPGQQTGHQGQPSKGNQPGKTTHPDETFRTGKPNKGGQY